MMLARIAANAFWMGRYAERAENLARLLSVTESFSADMDEASAWAPVLAVYCDTDAYAARGKPVTAVGVARYYLADRTNPGSVFSCIDRVRENARPLRHLISTESWRQISIFHGAIAAVSAQRFALSRLSAICEDVRLAACAHRGMIENTWYRDEVWLFNRIGAALERADQITRLLDMKSFQVDGGGDEPYAIPDVAWWNTLLRSASGYHAFQRRHSVRHEPEDAARFLLFDLQFPRSVRGAAEFAFANLAVLERDFDAKPGAEAKNAAKAFAERLAAPPAKLSGKALHRYLDQIQRDIIGLSNSLHERYFC